MNRKWAFYAGYGLAFFGALFAFIGFFLPWFVVAPSKLAAQMGGMFGDLFGFNSADLLQSLRLQLSGAQLALGLTGKQLIKALGDVGVVFDDQNTLFNLVMHRGLFTGWIGPVSRAESG